MPLGAGRGGLLYPTAAAAGAARTEVTVTVYGDAQIDTAQYKFGSASGLFDGTGDTLITDSTIDMTNGAWTFECFYRPNSQPATTIIFDPRVTSGYLNRILGTRNQKLAYYNGSWQVGTTAMSNGTWYHVAWSYDGSNMRVYLDGTQQISVTESGTFADTAVAIMGRFDAGAFYSNGHADEIRFSNTARYTSGFTAPTSAFSNDADTTLLLHCEGADGSTTFSDDYT